MKKKEKLENSYSDEESGFIKDKPLKLHIKKKKKKTPQKMKSDSFLQKQGSFEQNYACLGVLMRLILQ